MKLYEINKEQQYILNQMIYVANNDEITEAEQEIKLQELQNKMNSLSGEKEDKILNIGRFIKNELSEAEAIKNEIDNLTQRKRSCENKARWLKNYIVNNIRVGQEFKDSNTKISWRKSEVLEIDEGTEDRLPEKYIEFIPKILKSELKKDIKEGRTVLSNCRIVEKQNLQIK